MTFISRLAGAFLPLVLLVSAPAYAQSRCTIPASAQDQPEHARPDDPWIYRGTDIPVDAGWLFGELPNGLRYAVRQNDVPPCQVSMRVLIDAGSLYEREEERGFAHLIEHLIFRESRDFGNGEAIPHFQRLGAALGNDTNATTSPTQTVFQLDLPNANRTSLDDSVRLFSGMIREPALSTANLAADVPIVLSERREQAGPARRIAEATQATLFAGQLLAERNPIGTVETLEGATQDAVQDFHRRWYRPERAVIVLVGDADPRLLAALVERYFGDWQGMGPVEAAPDFGDPVAPAGAAEEVPVGEVAVISEPGQPRGMTYAIMRPWEEVVDNIEYNRVGLLGQVATAIVNRRLENAARENGSFLFAAVQRDKISRTVDGTFVTFAPTGDDWQTALADVRAVIADALSQPPSQAEIDRAVAQFDVAFVDMVEQSRIQASAALADQIVGAVDIREAVASPETFLEVFRSMDDRLNPERVFAATQALFEGEVIRAILFEPTPGAVADADLRAALELPVMADGTARDDGEAIDFATLPAIGTPSAPDSVQQLGVLEIETLTFPNGVRAMLMDRDNEPGRVTVRVRFGSGWRGFAEDEGVYAAIGQNAALVNSGLGPLDQNDLDRIAAGLKVSFSFRIEPGTFVFEGLTRQEDLAEQLYLFAAKLAMPRWDDAPVQRTVATMLQAVDSYDRDANAVLNRDLDWLLHDMDPRFATPDAATLQGVTPERFQQVWARLLAEGPVEVAVFGDIDREETIAALTETFGALPPRTPLPPEVAARTMEFPSGNSQPVVLTHAGDPDQAAAVIAWPTGAGSAGLVQSRRLELLAQIFSNRLLDSLRETAGAAYSPYVSSSWPLDVDTGGMMFALVQIEPDLLPAFFEQADEIALDLALNGPTQDELARVVEPITQYLARAQTGHTFWLNQLQGVTFDRNRLANLRTLYTDFAEATPVEIQNLAKQYLMTDASFRIQVVPADPAGAASAPAAAAPAGR